MSDGFVEVGTYWVRSSEIVRIRRTTSNRGRSWAYGIQVDLRHDGKYVTYTVSEAPDGPAEEGSPIHTEQEEAREVRNTYLRDLLDRMARAEGRSLW